MARRQNDDGRIKGAYVCQTPQPLFRMAMTTLGRVRARVQVAAKRARLSMSSRSAPVLYRLGPARAQTASRRAAGSWQALPSMPS